jgi:hypothetical protein
MSLAVQLLLTFVSLVAGSTIVLTVAAYRSSLASLEEDARRMARVAAEGRDDAMTQLFVTRHQRAEGFWPASRRSAESRGATGLRLLRGLRPARWCRSSAPPSAPPAFASSTWVGRLPHSGATRTTVVQPGAITSSCSAGREERVQRGRGAWRDAPDGRFQR